MGRFRYILLITFIIIFKPVKALGDTYIWTGAALFGSPTDWNVSDNWLKPNIFSPNLPSATDDVVMRPYLVSLIQPVNFPIITSGQNITCASITVTDLTTSPTLTINSGGSLTITGSNSSISYTNCNSANINVAGTLILSGTGGAGGSITFNTTAITNLTVGGTLSLTGAVGNITFNKTPTAAFTVNGVSTQTGSIAQTYNTTGNVNLALTGTGSISCSAINIGDAAIPSTATNYIATTKSNIRTLTVSGAITATSIGGTTRNSNAAFNIDNDNGTCVVTAASVNVASTTPAIGALASISLKNTNTTTGAITLKLTGATPVSIGNTTYGIIEFYPNSNAVNNTIEYGGTLNQTIPTASMTGLDGTPSVYQHIKFSGSGNKNISTGNLTISGDWTSTGSAVVVNAVSPTVIFQGTVPETLTDIGTNSGAGVIFKNVTFQGDTVKTITGATTSAFSIANTGVLTMAGTSTRLTVGTNGALTLISNSTGTAAVAKIPTYCRITGNVNVQRYIRAGTIANNARNYRLLSSPINNNSIIGDASSAAYSLLSYLTTTNTGVFIGGLNGTTNGFTVANASPTLYVYKESRPASSTTFNSGNFKGLTNILTNPMTGYDDAGTGTTANVNLYAGNGFMLYYVGNNLASTIVAAPPNKTTRGGSPSNFIDPDASTTTAIGTLNQGNIPVKLWYTGGTTTLTKVYTGFNLVGNPYAATINWDNFSTSDATKGIFGPSVSDIIYQFNPKNKNYSTYQANVTSANGGTNLIASGQGFFIRATDASAARLTFTEAAKITTTQPPTPLVFMGLPVQLAQTPQILHVQLAKDTVNTDEVALVFEPNAQNTVDDRDGIRLNGIGNVTTLATYGSGSTQQLAINHLSSIDSTTRVKLYVNSTGAAGINTLTATGFSTLDPRYDVFLIDHYKKDSLQISIYGKYDFNLDPAIAATFGDSRFELVFHKKSGLNYRLLSFTGNLVQSAIELKWTTQFEQTLTGFSVEKADAAGNYNQLYSLQSNGSGAYIFLDKTPLPGINSYRLKQIDAFDHITYSNIVSVDLTPAGDVNPPIMVYPNPAVGGLFNVKVTTPILPNQMLMRVIGLNGQTFMSKVWAGNNTQQNIGNLLPGTYIVEVSDSATKQIIGRVKVSKP